MRSSLKKILLLITLVIPVLTYLFLRSFGDNRYQLPVYYQEAESVASCGDLSFPHIIDINQVNLNSAAAHIFYFPDVVSKNELYRQLDRVVSKFDEVTAYALISEPSEIVFGDRQLITEDSIFQDIINCQLMMGEGKTLTRSPKDKLVLVDKFGRIRGYYNGVEFDDMDRLELELKILFTEYDYE